VSVTAQRRAFLLETIMGDPVKDEAERAALKYKYKYKYKIYL
jgi:hypothetical protein